MVAIHRHATFALTATLFTLGCASPGDRGADTPPPAKPAALIEIVRPGTRCDYYESSKFADDRRLIVTVESVREADFDVTTRRMMTRPETRYRYTPHAAEGAAYVTSENGRIEYRDSLLPKWLFRGDWSVGSRFEEKFEYPPRDLGPRRFHLVSEVLGWEEVTVPAGTFRALKVREYMEYHEQMIQGSFSGRARNLYWYSPERGCMVKTQERFGFWFNNEYIDRELID